MYCAWHRNRCKQCAAAVIHSRLTGDQRCEPVAHGRRTGRATPTVAYTRLCHGRHGNQYYAIGYESEKHAQKKKNCITNIIIIEVDDACKLCKCQGTKAARRSCGEGYFEVPSTPHVTNIWTRCVLKQVDTMTRATNDRMETQRELGNADRTGTPRSTCGSVLRY